ncbi:MAG: GAF domain-containing protein [Chryseolinea sp.]
MKFGFRSLKLNQKLSLLFSLPFLLVVGYLAYAFRHNLGEHVVGFLVLGLLLISFAVVTLTYIGKLGQGIKAVEEAIRSLADGNLDFSSNINGLPETTIIGKAMETLRADVVRQTEFAEQIRAGNLDTNYKPRHEQDNLGRALLEIKDNLVRIKVEDQQRNWASDGLAKFVGVLQASKNLKEISNDIIVNLVQIIKASHGAIYLATKDEKDKDQLELQACYAYNRSKYLTSKIAPGEGLLGQAFLEKQTIYLKKVPDHFVKITSGLGAANPRFVLIVPLRINESVVGILEVATFKELTKNEIEFVEKIGESIAYTVTSIRTADHTKRVVGELHQQAEHMRSQEEELRQNQEELQATQEAISRKYEALFRKLGDLNHQSKFDQLRSITLTKKRSIEYYFDIIRSQILTFSEDRMVVDATLAFRDAFYKVGYSTVTKAEQYNSLHDYYKTEFIPKLNDNTNFSEIADYFMPKDDRALLLQYQYISNNPHPTGKKSLLDDAGDESEYSSIHSSYHPILRNFLEKFGYYDIFLIDAKTGDMLYSVFKEVDFATSLISGHYHNTNFGKVVKKAIDSSDKDFVQLIDFEPYDPSYHAPASFIACPVYNKAKKIGILVFQMPINKINQILTGNNNWREDGLGETGETFMLGGDYKLRSIARQLIENTENHLNSLQRQQYDHSILQQIRKMETSILMEEMKQEGVSKALTGQTGTLLEKNGEGVELLTAYAPLEIPDVHWIIMSTMTEEEASTPINSLRNGSFE